MPKKFHGYEMPEFTKADLGEDRIADLFARSEDDFKFWLEYARFRKDINKVKGSLMCVNGEPFLVVKEPYTGIRRACLVESDEFLNEIHQFISITGSRSMRDKVRRG